MKLSSPILWILSLSSLPSLMRQGFPTASAASIIQKDQLPEQGNDPPIFIVEEREDANHRRVDVLHPLLSTAISKTKSRHYQDRGRTSDDDDEAPRFLRPKKSGSSSSKSKKKSSASKSKSCKSSKKSSSSSCDGKLIVPEPTVFCNGNCTLENGSFMSVYLDLSDAFPGLVRAPPTSADTSPNGQQRRMESLRHRRWLADQIVTGSFQGETSISEGNNAIQRRADHYTYVIDVSGSTSGNIRQVEIDAIRGLNTMLAKEGIVQGVSIETFNSNGYLHTFDNQGTPQFLVAPGDSAVNTTLAAISLSSGGGTNFDVALEKTRDIVERALQDPLITRTAVVFITDGAGNNIPDDLIQQFVNMGTKVHTATIVLGQCSPGMKAIAEATGAGICHDIADPADLATRLQEYFFSGRALGSINVTLDSVDLPIELSKDIPAGTGLLPRHSPLTYQSLSTGFDVAFNVTHYVHELCVEAMTNVTGDASANCCINFTMQQFLNTSKPALL